MKEQVPQGKCATDSSFPLTSLQQSMYACAALTGRPWQYVEQVVIHLPSPLVDVDAMGQAWTELYASHPALRMAISADPSGALSQQPAAPTRIVPIEQDWRTEDATDRMHDFLTQDRNKGIDATIAPAFRLSVLHTGPAQSTLVWSFPHSLLDGRAFAPLLDEVFQRYARIKSGATQQEPDAPLPNIFQAHCNLLADMDHGAGTAHFAKKLAGWEGTQGVLQEGASPTRKVEVSFELSPAQTKAVESLAQQAEVSASTVILAAWGITLARFSGQSDVVFGNTRNGRHLVNGAATAAGCFITTVPMGLRLDPSLTLGAVLQELRQEQIAVRPFEHTPLIAISRELGLSPGRSLFDSTVMFDFGTLQEQLGTLNDDWSDRTVELFEESDTPISVAAYMGAQLRLVVEYDPAQVPRGAQLAECLFAFMAGLGTVTSDSPLGSVSMLNPDTTQQITDLAGPDATFLPQGKSCLDRIEDTARKWPDHLALMQPDSEALSYGALDLAADQLAGNLIAAGVRHGDAIGICMARCPQFIIAMLAIWKAGAAFVPMDPGYPQTTLEIIAHDSAARLILTDETAPKLDAPTRDIASLMATNAPPLDQQSRNLDDLAYIIFTSGSTGRPKGVMITHRSLAAHADAIVPLFELEKSDKVLQFAALSFDVALEEIIPTLVSGATLMMRNEVMAQSVQECLNHLETHEVTVVNLPTGFWVTLTEVLDSHDIPFPSQVRLLIVGGERVPLSVLKRWHERVPDLRWMNGYGPTETTITCTVHEMATRDLEGETVPIGRPLSHARVWVMSNDGALVPEGVEGQLYVSGPAVAKGYIGDPQRTEKSFTQAIFDPAVGRIYATGDRAMWKNGLLYYLGRVDRQIKLRGFRIEPGQIEAALEKQDIIDRAHVDVLNSPSGQQQLVAWYSTTTGAEGPTPQDIGETLSATLPPQMRPVLVPVTTWPQTPGGKVDVARLPRPAAPEAPPQDTVGMDGVLIEEVVQQFRNILQLENVGPQTSFFEAGGDSLSLLRLMPELERVFDVKIEPTAIYADPTPQGVVRALIEQDPDPLVVIPIQPKGTLAPLYAVHVLGDNGSYYRPLSRVLGDQQPVFGLTVGLLSENTPTAVSEIAKFYLHQIERHHPTGPLSLIAVSAGSYVTLELAQLLKKAGRDVQALILLDAEGPAGRARVGPVRRVAVHLGAILRQGWPYVTKQLEARKETTAQNQAREKLLSSARKGTETPADDIANVDDFVAANMIAIEHYEPQPYERRLTIYRAGDDKFDSDEALHTGLGWSCIAAAGFDLIDVPGDHLGILADPNVEVLGANISRLMERSNSDRDG